MTKKNEVATTDGGKPSYLAALEKGGAVRNNDNFDQSDVVVPRVKLLQGLSKECEAFEGAKPGVFWHTGFDEALGKELDFVVCSRRKKYLLVAPLEDGQGILARSEDFVNWDRLGSWEVKLKDQKTPVTWAIEDLNVVKSGLDQWGSMDPADENSPPAATLFYEYLVILPDAMHLGPVVLSLTRSQVKKAKKGLNDKIALHESAGRPMQAIVFTMVAENDTNASGQDFKNFRFNGNGFASEEVYKQAMDLQDVLQNYKVQDEEGAATGEDEVKKAESDKF